jgi:mono/diheme cytochrome c family protein
MASPFSRFFHRGCDQVPCGPEGPGAIGEWEGTWYWLRSKDQEERVTASIFNRYCIRCHGVDGRGVWDIPDVPNFTNAVWQACHSDGQLARSILEGRGAVMPPFRGVLSLEEAWAMARYIRTFLPDKQASRPDYGPKKKSGTASKDAEPQ